jgi:hypothetical protein
MHNRGSISTGYDVDNSLKLESDNTERVNKAAGTISGAGNRKTFTISFWTKRTEINGVKQYLFEAGNSDADNDRFTIRFGTGDSLDIQTSATYLITNRVFRDTYAWYHIVLKVDTTEGTAANRMKLYVNGVEETSFATDNRSNINQNFDFAVNNTEDHVIGNSQIEGSKYYNGYIADWIQLDGTAAGPTSFGEFDEDSNIWKPIDPSALSFGTNGFWLNFKDSSNLGNDASGGTDFTLTNIAAADQATDTPTNNFPILVPMYAYAGTSVTISEGGLECDINMPSNSAFNPNTSAMSSFQMSGTDGGKWYMESKITSNNRAFVGIVSSLAFLQQTVDPTEFVYWDFYNGWIGSSLISTETNPPDAAVNTIIGMAIDCDNQRVTFSKNGGWLQANGDMNGSTPSDWRWDWTSDANFLTHPNCNGNVAFWCGIADNNNVWRPIHQVNFGGFSPYTISSGNADENGYGNFEYAVPSGFYALCTKNLAEYG